MAPKRLWLWVAGVAFILTLGAAGFYGALFLRSMIRHGWAWDHLTALLLLWQTQTGAAFALFTALAGAAVLLDQAQAADRRIEARRERRAKALLAVLPLMLSELSDYAAGCVAICAEVLISHWPGDAPLPLLPTGFVGQLTDLIEAIPPDHARSLTTLVRRVQRQHARAVEFRREVLSLDEPKQNKLIIVAGERVSILDAEHVYGCLIDAIEIHANCGVLFPYARGGVSSPAATISVDNIQRSAFLTVPDSILDQVREEIDRLATTSGDWPDARGGTTYDRT
jgi:hypothetical protein